MESLPAFARRFAHLVLGLSLIGLFAGCASSTASVIARRDARFDFSPTNKITLATHPKPSKSTLALQQALVAVLQERGIELVPPAEAEFTLTYWLDDSWKPGKKVVYLQRGGWTETYPMNSGPLLRVPGGMMSYFETPTPPRPRVVDSPYYVQGIRLKLYPMTGAGAGQFQPAWEGYIEGGDRVSTRREPVLLRALLQYFGQDFIGRAKLVQ